MKNLEIPPPTELTSALLEVAAETEALNRALGRSVTEVMADWVAAQYLLAARKQLAALPEGPERVKLLRLAAADVVALQRGSHWDHRLQLDREKLKLEREKFEVDQQRYKDEVAARPENRKRPDYLRPLTDEERRAIVAKADEIMGLA